MLKGGRWFSLKVPEMIEFLERWLLRAVGVLTGSIVLAIASILMLQVLGRHVFEYPIPWPEEVAGFLFVWLIFLGAIVAYRQGGLIGIDWLLGKMPGRVAGLVRLISDTLVMGLLVGLIWTGVEATIAASGSSTTVLRFSWAWVYLAFPIGCTILLLAFLVSFVRDLARLRHGGSSDRRTANEEDGHH